jgi:hypothetical protein
LTSPTNKGKIVKNIIIASFVTAAIAFVCAYLALDNFKLPILVSGLVVCAFYAGVIFSQLRKNIDFGSRQRDSI